MKVFHYVSSFFSYSERNSNKKAYQSIHWIWIEYNLEYKKKGLSPIIETLQFGLLSYAMH